MGQHLFLLGSKKFISTLYAQVVIYVHDDAPGAPELLAEAARRFNISLPGGGLGSACTGRKHAPQGCMPCSRALVQLGQRVRGRCFPGCPQVRHSLHEVGLRLVVKRGCGCP